MKKMLALSAIMLFVPFMLMADDAAVAKKYSYKWESGKDSIEITTVASGLTVKTKGSDGKEVVLSAYVCGGALLVVQPSGTTAVGILVKDDELRYLNLTWKKNAVKEKEKKGKEKYIEMGKGLLNK